MPLSFAGPLVNTSGSKDIPWPPGTGCASPASRASSEGGEMLTFAHIPTGTTVNKAMHIDDSKSRGVAPAAALTTIGADIEPAGLHPKNRLRLSHKWGPPQR